jgi:hypothetical protein
MTDWSKDIENIFIFGARLIYLCTLDKIFNYKFTREFYNWF